MRRCAAIRVHDDFPSGEPGVPMWPTNNKAARWIDQIMRSLEHFLWKDRLDNGLDDRIRELILFKIHVGMVLRRQYDCVDGDRFAIPIADSDLRLRIGTEPR